MEKGDERLLRKAIVIMILISLNAQLLGWLVAEDKVRLMGHSIRDILFFPLEFGFFVAWLAIFNRVLEKYSGVAMLHSKKL